MLRVETDSKLQLRKQHEETIDHLTSGCPILTKNEYLMRQDKVGTHLHYSICKAHGIGRTDEQRTQTCCEGKVLQCSIHVQSNSTHRHEELQQMGQI